MAIDNPKGLDSVLRLSGLKNAIGRRVLPGAEFLQDLEPAPTDVSGTAPALPNFANLAPRNEPQADLGGELSPQSYDVRANVVEPAVQAPKEPEGVPIFSTIGNYLKKVFTPENKNPYTAKNQNQVAPNFAPGTQNIPNAEKTIGQNVAEFLTPKVENLNPNQYIPPPENKAPPLFENLNPHRKNAPPLNSKGEVINQDEVNAAIAQAQEQPWQFSAYGAANEVANHPALEAEFKKVTGIDFTPQIQEQVTQYEAAMKGVEDALHGNNQQLAPIEEGIKQRILSNQATDQDKYLIAAALLMPLLVGAVFGKEAGLGALGGAAGGLAGIAENRTNAIREDEEALLNLNKQRQGNLADLANIQANKAKYGQDLQKNLPNQPNEHLIGLDYVEYDDPETGEKIQGYEFAPGLVAKGKYVNNEKSVDHMRKKADEISETKDYVESINDITGNVVNAVSQLKNKNILQKAFIAAIQGKAKGSLSALTDKILINGREVTAGPYLEQQLGFLANKYGMAQKIGQLDRAAQNHIEKIILNPTSTLTSNADAIEQMINIRNLAQEDLIKQVKNKGFIPEFTIRDLSKNNEEFLKKPNKKATEERQNEIDRKLSQG